MKCQHRSKTGRKCGNDIIGNSKYCYLKSHYPTRHMFEMIKTKIIDNFKYTTLSADDFELYNVKGDGACLYRSLAQGLYKQLQYLHNHPLFNVIMGIVGEDRMAIDGEFLDEETETELAIFLQRLIKEWLYKRQDNMIKELGLTIRDLIQSTHDMNMDVYRDLYEIFAGEADVIKVENDDIEKLVEIPNRWGGTPEQYGFSMIFQIGVKIHDLVTLDSRKFTIKEATFRYKLKRIRFIQGINVNSLNEDINIFYTNVKGAPHYMYMSTE